MLTFTAPIPRRILVIDDNSDAASSLAALLEILGHNAAFSTNGYDGIEIALMFRPEVAFVDIGMPNIDGFEVARRLRRMPELLSMKLVALTAWGDEETKRKASMAGFDEHLTKPASLDAIVELLGVS